MTLPTLSLIVPVFNAERDLEAFLQSLAQQTLPPTETIFIDDGSTDGSQRMLATYAAGKTAVRIIRKANGGAGAARNTGLGVATGSYIAFADADDLLAPDIRSNSNHDLRMQMHSGILISAMHFGYIDKDFPFTQYIDAFTRHIIKTQHNIL